MFRSAPKKDGRGSEMLVLDAIRSGIRFQKFVAEAALKVGFENYELCYVSLLPLNMNYATYH